jgi:hypothetical protein
MTSLVQNWVGSVMVSRAVDVPDYNVSRFGNTTSIERLPTEPIGSVTLTFDGVQAGSEVRIYDQLGAAAVELAGVESCDVNPGLVVPYYGPGQTAQVVIIALSRKIKSFPISVPSSDATVPAQQDVDPWYSNP